MKFKTPFFAAVLAVLFSVPMTASAQDGKSGKIAKSRGLEISRAVSEAKAGRSNVSFETLARVQEAYNAGKSSPAGRTLTGTWNVTVPVDGGEFHALHTFANDGTFVETSSLLATLTEGPAHGVWERRGGGAVLTFELFAFDPDGNEVGRVRVRNAISLTDDDHFSADSVVDFIELDGTVIEAIAGGSYTGVRMQLRGL
jgi:hypothetical protein